MIGSTLSRFRVTGELGAGGMGEVYLAEDSALGREVAIKVLPQAFAADAERVARFEREARVLASLSHPNVAAIYEVGREKGTTFLVMELARGETLGDRMARGALPPDEALAIALQVAEGLEAAHGHGIVHRDLKPANVMVDEQGCVKVLDFGLAKALDPEPASPASRPTLSQSPTMTYQATVAGMLLGTAAYMAPEQAKGQAVDKRSDIWAFGVMLWEMLAGKRLFTGDTVSDILAAVLRAEIDLSALPPATPAAIRSLLRRCLARDPRQRLHAIADARIEIAEALAGVGDEPPRRSPISRLSVAIFGVVALALTGLGGWLAGRAEPPAPEAIRLPLPLLDGFNLAFRNHSGIAMSPDGRRQVVVAYGADGIDVLVARELGQLEPWVLEGTAEARAPFFSPDGDWVGFFAASELRRVPFGGGPVERLAPTSGQDRGASWSPDGTIFFSPGPEEGLFRLPAGGGVPAAVTTLDASRGERTHRWPHVLPGGRHVLFTSDTVDTPQAYDDARIEALTVASGQRRVLIEGASRAASLGSGHILFSRGGSLFAASFDPRRAELTGEPELLLQGVTTHVASGAVHFAVSDAGSLLYVPGGAEQILRRPAWVTGPGTVASTRVPPGPFFNLALAPDGQRVALTRVGERRNDLWVADLAHGSVNRLTFDGGMSPVWTPDGRRLAYQRSSVAAYAVQDSNEVLWKAADGSDDEQVLWTSETSINPNSFSPDASLLIVTRYETPTASSSPGQTERAGTHPTAVSRDYIAGAADLWVVPLDGGEPRLLFSAPGVQYAAELSPDGRWLAYLSDETGRYEVYVRHFPGPEGKWQVSASGGAEPHWSRDGRWLYYRHRRDLLRVPVELGEAFSAGPAERITSGQVESTNPRTYSVAPDGRIIFLEVLGRSEPTRPILVLDLAAELESSRE